MPSKPSRLLRRIVLIVVPLLAAAGWFALQPSDRMRAPDSSLYLPTLLYDEYDLSAMALRGLNAERGRQAGFLDNTPLYRQEDYADELLEDRPLLPRYFLEYPHAALLLFRVGYWIQPAARDVPVPPVVADGDYHNIATYAPSRPDEVRLWRSFVVASRFYFAVMLICYFLLMATLEWGYGPGTGLRGGALLLLLPAVLYFTFNRYDVIPALLTAVSFACLGRRWHGLSGAVLAAAVLVKVYPLLLAPLVLRYLWSDRRAAGRWLGVFVAVGTLAFAPLLFGADLRAVLAPYRFQLTRAPEIGMTIYGCLLPPSFAFGLAGGLFRFALLGGAMAVVLWRPILKLSSVLRRGALVLLVFVSFSVFFSPQWVVWFAPLLFPLASRDRSLGKTFIALDAITYATFPLWFWLLPECVRWLLEATVGAEYTGSGMVAFVYMSGNALRFVRFAICALLAWQLVRAEWPRLVIGRWLARRIGARVASRRVPAAR